MQLTYEVFLNTTSGVGFNRHHLERQQELYNE